MADILEWLALTPVAVSLKRSAILYMFANAAHILSIGLLVGAILPLDLRLVGLFRTVPLEAVGPFLSRAAGFGLCAAVATGLCLFAVRPFEYVQNPAFLAKVGLLALGAVNVLVVHAGQDWRIAVSDGVVSPALRISAALSMMTWIAAIVAGRWIGFL
ncbi:DUF6644 family protein [Rhizobium sp. BK251]|uniref:DUF6644 family protein n=1 Tax=Rhizobium sp. BK251 TaxID=2512125 RepID=UPI001042F0D2|nr:DUF6644 family protein [Rhizobium sp. BK251]